MIDAQKILSLELNNCVATQDIPRLSYVSDTEQRDAGPAGPHSVPHSSHY